MSLWLSGVLLVVALFLSSSALSVEECKPLVTPLSTFKPMYGRWNFIMGYTDNEIFDAMLRSTQSNWVTFSQSPSSPNQFREDVGIKLPGYCKYASAVVTIVGNSAISQKSNFTCTFHSLPTCKDCLLYSVNSINNNNLYHMMNISNPTTKEQLQGYRALYLMARETSISTSDLEHFKKQAICLGFTGEPDFHYDPKNEFCTDEHSS